MRTTRRTGRPSWRHGGSWVLSPPAATPLPRPLGAQAPQHLDGRRQRAARHPRRAGASSGIRRGRAVGVQLHRQRRSPKPCNSSHHTGHLRSKASAVLGRSAPALCPRLPASCVCLATRTPAAQLHRCSSERAPLRLCREVGPQLRQSRWQQALVGPGRATMCSQPRLAFASLRPAPWPRPPLGSRIPVVDVGPR